MSRADDTEAKVRARWMRIVTWTSKPGRESGKVYTHANFPQLVQARDFWAPWASAWDRGDKDETALMAQIANLMRAEEEARAINGDKPDGTSTIVPPRIPVPFKPEPIGWDMVADTPTLSAADKVDAAAAGMGIPRGELFPTWAKPAAMVVGAVLVVSTLLKAAK